MDSFIDSLLSLLSFTELPYSVLVVIAILITGIGVFEHWFDIKNIAKLIQKITNANK